MRTCTQYVLIAIILLLAIIPSSSDAAAPGKLHYFSFCRGKNTDPVSQQQRGNDLAEMVKNSVEQLADSFQINFLSDKTPYSGMATVSVKTIRDEFARYRDSLTPDDTILIYSHSHGLARGLLIDKEVYSYQDLANDLLSLPARNVIYLVMACHSGAFTDTLKSSNFKSLWENRQKESRNFLVMTPVDATQISYPTSIDGKMLNPFTYAITQAFKGKADASGDQKTTFTEFVAYVIKESAELSKKPNDPSAGFKPQFTGSYKEDASFIPLGNASAEKGSSEKGDSDATSALSSIIDEAAEKLIDPSGKNGTPGLVVGIAGKDFEAVHGFGKISLKSKQKPDKNTLFAIGSVSKVFTGICLSKTVCDKTVRLTDQANRLLDSDLKLHPLVTLKHLISHYSGLPNFPENISAFRDLDGDGKNDSTQTEPARNYTRRLLARYLNIKGRTLIPGKEYKYSNLGVAMAALALQKKFKFPDYDAMIQGLIARPVGLKSTGTNCRAFFNRAGKTQATGFCSSPGGSIREMKFSDMGILEGAGELISNASDLLILLKGLSGIKADRLSNAYREAMQPLATQNQTMRTGYAIDIWPGNNGKLTYGKFGATAGFSAMLFWQNEPPVGMVILANRGNFDQKFIPTAKTLFEDVVNELSDQGSILKARIENEIRRITEEVGSQAMPEGFIDRLRKKALQTKPALNESDPDFKNKFEALGFKVLEEIHFLSPRQARIVQRWFRLTLHREPDLSGFIRRGYAVSKRPGSLSSSGGM
ncbi:MAG: hypothetical protein CVV42_10415 [Candidatus Riflebacteria bacterium HGW-Riflebacteria-2]|jgi:CubicO group peptidase (beta-lactamase class C family)|nr:MAG: hypothetical protein CVV42_10415 [Candidatus Riflebacteria bacterium HGW-Riflebacteria-2]